MERAAGGAPVILANDSHVRTIHTYVILANDSHVIDTEK